MVQLYVCVYIYFRFFSLIGYYRILSIVPCAVTVGSCWERASWKLSLLDLVFLGLRVCGKGLCEMRESR